MIGRGRVLGFAVTLALACARPTQLAYETEVAEAPVAALHAVHSERIRERMAGLERLERGRLPQAMDIELERGRRIHEITLAARSLAEGAGALAKLAPELELDEADREAFATLARKLERDSHALAEAAPRLSLAGMQDRAATLRADCDSCHDRFRIARAGDER